MTTKKKAGRPRIEFTDEKWKLFVDLCELHCTLPEIASVFNCSEDTITRRVKEKHDMTFEEYYVIASAGGRVSLRRHQFALAAAGNATMLIWLGKQFLGQTDKQVISQRIVGQFKNVDDMTEEELDEEFKKYQA